MPSSPMKPRCAGTKGTSASISPTIPLTSISSAQGFCLARVAGQIAIHGSISEDLIAFGYESDESWLAALKGVPPDLTPSHWPESIARPIWRTRYTRYLEAAKIAAARVVGSPVV